MLLGVILKGLNCILRRDWIDFVLDFIPQLVFMTALFGYLIFLIVFKWTNEWVRAGPPPNILSILVNMQAVAQLYHSFLRRTL